MGRQKQSEKRALGRALFSQGYSKEEISYKLKVSKTSISRWSREDNWELLKKNLVASKSERLSELYDELAELGNAIKSREEGLRYPTSQEADIRRKLIKDINDLETKYNVAEASVIGREFTLFCQHLTQDDDPDLKFAKQVNDTFELFIDHLIDKQRWQ